MCGAFILVTLVVFGVSVCVHGENVEGFRNWVASSPALPRPPNVVNNTQDALTPRMDWTGLSWANPNRCRPPSPHMPVSVLERGPGPHQRGLPLQVLRLHPLKLREQLLPFLNNVVLCSTICVLSVGNHGHV